jgi:hypothetical protein
MLETPIIVVLGLLAIVAVLLVGLSLTEARRIAANIAKLPGAIAPKCERLRAAITCLAETNPPWPTRLRRSKRRLRHNRERSHLPHPLAKCAIPKGP